VRDLSLLGGRSPTKLAEVNVKEFLYLLVFHPVLLAYLLVGQPLFHGFELGGGAVLVCAANVDGVVAHQPALAVIYVCREYTSDDVAQMWHVVYLR